MTIIGPSFDTELRQAGITDRRFSWGADGTIEFHPDVQEPDRKKVRDVLAAHDGLLSRARHDALEAIRAEAARRMARPFDQPPDSTELVFAEINALTRALQAVELGVAAPLAEKTELTRVKALWVRGRAIRDVRAAAKSAVLSATTVAAVEAVSPVWPA